ncbi:MAG: universal stress protein [Desulfobacterales bacterium]|jgi:nucleotide-binding universal stress UspA family protein|nr:universal stress protein [Desulfobacterales bacterium]
MMKILVAYVGGLDADNAVLEVAKKHAKAFNATLYIASSMERVSEKEQMNLQKVEKQLAYVKETLDAEGIACETHILVRGLTPGEDIVEFAVDRKMDEIIIGIEKTSKVGKLLFGSNAQYIILESPCPVVSVK